MDTDADTADTPAWWADVTADPHPASELEALLEDGAPSPDAIAAQILDAEAKGVEEPTFERVIDLYQDIQPRTDGDQVNIDYIEAYAEEQSLEDLETEAAALNSRFANLKTFQKGSLMGTGLGVLMGGAAHTVLNGTLPDWVTSTAADLGGLVVQYAPVIGQPIQHTIHQYPEVYAGVLAGQALGYAYGASRVYRRKEAEWGRMEDPYPDAVAELDARLRDEEY